MGSGSYSEFNENKTSSHKFKPESELSKSTQPQQIQKSSYLKIAEGVSNSQNSKNTAAQLIETKILKPNSSEEIDKYWKRRRDHQYKQVKKIDEEYKARAK